MHHNKSIIIIASAILVSVGAYLLYNSMPLTKLTGSDALIIIDGKAVVTIPEFEEYLGIMKEGSKTPESELAQGLYMNLWQMEAIKAWNKKHAIDQLPEYQEHLKKAQEREKEHPEQIAKTRKELLENKIQCMYLIECWFGNIDNAYFVQNFPTFKSFMKEGLTFDQFGELMPQMFVDLNNDLTTTENVDYLKRKNIKSVAEIQQETIAEMRKRSMTHQ